MKAIITGTPLQIEGEPAEIAQLVELLSTGAVMVEHVHRWRIAELDGSATVKGSCWCGQEREFEPHLPDGVRANNSTLFAKEPPRIGGENVVAVKKPQRCRRCGEHPRSTRHRQGLCVA